MSAYDKKTSAAPETPYCGLEINVSLSVGPDNDKSLKTVNCTSGTVVQPIQLPQNEMLSFTSTLTEGSFTRGYCLQIFRQSAKTKSPALHIQCSQGMNNKTSYSQTVLEDAFSTQYVIIGACAGVFVFVITLVVVLMYTWRIRNNDPVIAGNNKELTQIKSENDAAYDSEGMKRNILYHSSEQCDIMDGNYHTVELEEIQEVDNTQNIDGDYISIDENFSSNSKYKSKPGIQLKCKTQMTKELLGYKVEHVTPGTGDNVEYAVVNKTERLGATSLNNEYAVVDKSGKPDKNIKHVTPKTEALHNI
ncbi:Hypothetical predicted protein [Mytilus galloprovincialis]|nr:Hypothetical predicted protein [Mytilus galloprovincialis]